ncbi:beta-mannosidase, partial [Micromonospora sp. KC606]|uniref:cellulose binding domain-containing protein n=1 Tax=Micromonospora sp. KC606 TaxID=2530379 RepID=UPI0010D91EF4
TSPAPSSPAPSTPAPSTPAPSTPAPSTPAPGGCTATYTVVNSWSGGFQGEVKVTAGNAAINGWTVRWTFANGQSISQAWNAEVTRSGSAVTARNLSYNGRLGAGASTNFGFIGSSSGNNPVPAVTCTAS